MNMKIEESNWKLKNQTNTILNVYTQLQSQCLFSHFLSVWQVQILTVYAHWVRQRKNSHFTLLKTEKELDNFSYCQVTAQWMILCFLSKQTKVNWDGGGYKKVLKKGTNTYNIDYRLIFNGLNKKDIKGTTDALH